jgi:hypothetical protein
VSFAYAIMTSMTDWSGGAPASIEAPRIRDVLREIAGFIAWFVTGRARVTGPRRR